MRGGLQVYFIVGGGRTKVGISSNPRERMRTFQSGSPAKLRLVYAAPGDFKLEQELHHDLYCRGRWSHGEWFDGEFTAQEAKEAVAAAPRASRLHELSQQRRLYEVWAANCTAARSADAKALFALA